MTKLQKLAIRRIEKLAKSMDIEMCVRVPFGSPTVDEIKARDAESLEKWRVSTEAQREILEWTGGLLAEKEEEP